MLGLNVVLFDLGLGFVLVIGMSAFRAAVDLVMGILVKGWAGDYRGDISIREVRNLSRCRSLVVRHIGSFAYQVEHTLPHFRVLIAALGNSGSLEGCAKG